MADLKSIAVVGAGIYGQSLAVALRKRGHSVTVFDQHKYDETGYEPSDFRAEHETMFHYQRLSLESREAWMSINEKDGCGLIVPCGMLRVQPTEMLGALEKETLADMPRYGLRDTQFVNPEERKRAASLGWMPTLSSSPFWTTLGTRLSKRW
ncbi:FAD dependent oxidoreductase [Tolypocladium paradoxum]|uniref:FAD dependent oxidoreductase n=1 Tax=Tolypocladium paradoxum TaxID=94208 RepID=A0A2S4KPL8_9HYPO|nr:FAD dependent oxidoreductase [Tolypocladium paradoxum]